MESVKTTTIGKLAYQFKKANKSVYLGAADTFRAAAVEQLGYLGYTCWSARHQTENGVRPCFCRF